MSAGRLCQACGQRNAREVTLCGHCKKPVFDLALWRAGWRVLLDRPRVPASWPAEVGPAGEGARCQGCDQARWYRLGDGVVCGTCHPPGGAVEWIATGEAA